MITEIDDFYAKGCGRCDRFATADCSTRPWESGLRELRAIALELGLVEAVKWGHPCFMHRDRNVAILGAFRSDFRLSFFDAALLADPDRILERQGPNTRHPDMIRFTENAHVAERASIVRRYLRELMDRVEEGVRPPRDETQIELPAELVDALASDPELADAFQALTPGRQRSWAIRVGSAKKPATRVARIERGRDRILAGKGALER